ncbi:hypothetical protein [Streptosporangium sp. NBC_01756]|uniref:hypothetical protein n=1 Tax=Streptosporangium sp. NBC_01756 TaxID=2975950 RepID=UPI002DD92F85|nr:hypothetical protein [Streptosporangium sp. NBC_01756]WSC90437.1 hypothetical protein OIE48_20365 [Streptosporangium sp. NBC_01756]
MLSRRFLPRRPLFNAALGVIAASMVLTSQGTAVAAANPYTPEGICGAGYRVIDSMLLRNVLSSSDAVGGRTYLLYNSGNKYNCVVTIKSVAVGTPSQVTADLQIFSGNSVDKAYRDRGNYTYYAGPVKAYAAGKCVATYGDVKAGGNSYANSSPKGHCG